MFKRPPDLIIGTDYLHRWYVIPKNRWINIYLHKFYGNDDERALHDHPWVSMSILLKGEVKEHQLNKVRLIPKWFPVFRRARFAHRLELVQGPVITLFITGPKVRKWGFHCPNNWKPWHKFTDAAGTGVGAGCGENNDD